MDLDELLRALDVVVVDDMTTVELFRVASLKSPKFSGSKCRVIGSETRSS